MKKHPKFQRPNFNAIKRVRHGWRKPRGIDSKQRQKLKWAGAVVKVGYRSDNSRRFMHPTGKKEFFVHSKKDLQAKGIDKFVLRLSATLSSKSKAEIRKKAAEMKVHVLN